MTTRANNSIIPDKKKIRQIPLTSEYNKLVAGNSTRAANEFS